MRNGWWRAARTLVLAAVLAGRAHDVVGVRVVEDRAAVRAEGRARGGLRGEELHGVCRTSKNVGDDKCQCNALVAKWLLASASGRPMAGGRIGAQKQVGHILIGR